MPPNENSDDVSIPDNEILLRRLFSAWIEFDQDTGQERIKSSAFKDSRDPVSIEILSLTTLEDAFDRASEKLLARFTAKNVREAGCGVIRRPEQNNPSHAKILGGHKKGGPTTGEARKIARAASIIRE